MSNSPNSTASLKFLPPREAIAAEILRRKRNKAARLFPDAGDYRRELYARHLEFFAAGATHPERLFMAANRVGKTETGAYEITCHLTGDYPGWWPGKRFDGPIEAWAGGLNNNTTRDVIQDKLLGKPGEYGTGMIPGDSIIHITNKQGLPNAVDTIYVRHKSGGRSILGLKSYEQGREAWQGTAKHAVWLDEEPGLDVYIEALYRTATTGGVMLLTFTPLLGMSDVVKSFLEPEDPQASTVKHVTTASWDDVPHLTAQAKAALIASTPPYQRDARTRGIPQLGIGAIYPIAESDFVVPRFDVPKHWPRAYGMDVGWKRTAAVWGALDRDTSTLYLYHEHYRGQAEPVIHAESIKAPGAWIPGVIDPACMGSGQIDGRNLMDLYRDLGLDLEPAINAVESGIYAVWELLSAGRLKVFGTLQHWLSEFRKYHRDEKGKLVKEDDHLMDACVAPETLVVTNEGPMRIIDLVGLSGRVLSRSGAWARFLGARKTIADTPVVTVRFNDGSEVTCTPDHPFLTPLGWKKALEMRGLKCYNGVSQRVQYRSRLSGEALPSSSPKPLRCFRENAITFAANIFSAMASAFIGGFGKLRTASIFRAGTTFTTGMDAEHTIGRRTSNLSYGQSTKATITPDTNACPTKQSPQLPLGTLATRAATGTSSIMRNSSPRPCLSSHSSYANTARRNSRALCEEITGFARITARRSIAKRLVWTTSNVLAWFATEALWRIATFRNEPARESALLHCVSVIEAGRSDVYCLTVPGNSCFCVASGAVVHNTRYLVVSGRDRLKAPPVKREERVQYEVSGRLNSASLGWMS